jgi:hypothetical protein
MSRHCGEFPDFVGDLERFGALLLSHGSFPIRAPSLNAALNPG